MTTTVGHLTAVNTSACLDLAMPRGRSSHDLATRCASVSLRTLPVDDAERASKRRSRMAVRALASAWAAHRSHPQSNFLTGSPAEPVLATCGSATLNFAAFPTSPTEATISGLTTGASNHAKLLLYISAVQARLVQQHEKLLIADSVQDDAMAHASIAALPGTDELDVETNAQPLLSAVPGRTDAEGDIPEPSNDNDSVPVRVQRELVDALAQTSPKLPGVPNTTVDNDRPDSPCPPLGGGAHELLQLGELAVQPLEERSAATEGDGLVIDNRSQESHHDPGSAGTIDPAECFDEPGSDIVAAISPTDAHSDAYDGCYTYNESCQSSVYAPEPWSYSGEEPIWDFSMVGYENPFADPHEDSGASESQEYIPLEDCSAEAAFWGEARKPVCNVDDKIFEKDFILPLDHKPTLQSDYEPPLGDIEVVENAHVLNKNVYARYDFGVDIPVIEISPPPQDFASVAAPPPNDPIPMQDEAFGYQLAVVGTRQAASRSTVSVVTSQDPAGQPMYAYMIYEHDQWKPAYSCPDGAKTTLAWYVQDPDASWRRVRPRDVQMF